MSVPQLVIVVPLQGEPGVYVDAQTAEEAVGLKADLEQCPLAEQVAQPLDQAIPKIRSRRWAE